MFREAVRLLADRAIDVAEFLHAPIGLEDVVKTLAATPGVKHPVWPAR